MHGGFTPRGPSWRAWIVVLAIALIGATSASEVWHETDEDCAVCQLRHDSVADVVEHPRIAPADLPQSPAPALVVRFIASHLDARLPARAPPA